MSEHFGEVVEELDAVFYVDGGVQATVAYRAHGDGVCESGAEAKVGGLEFVHGMSTFERVGCGSWGVCLVGLLRGMGRRRGWGWTGSVGSCVGGGFGGLRFTGFGRRI